jgi:hypothetical protein
VQLIVHATPIKAKSKKTTIRYCTAIAPHRTYRVEWFWLD